MRQESGILTPALVLGIAGRKLCHRTRSAACPGHARPPEPANRGPNQQTAATRADHGALANLDQTYGALGTNVAELEIGVDRPIRELYLVTHFDTDDQARLLTEVCWPVLQTTPAQ
jgi:hypothetical protein